MDKKSATSKMIRRKYKRYAAAVAGAAIMAGAGLPAVVSAADNTTGMTYHNDQQSVKKVATKSSKNTRSNKSTNRGGWHEHRTSWPSSSENRGWVDENGRIYYSSDNYRSGHYRNGAHYDTRYDGNRNGHYDSRYDGRSRGYYNGGYYYSGNDRTGSTTVSPVEFAKTYASQYGFDRNKDSFSLVSQTGSSASVLIKKSTTGKQFIMNLERDNYRSWEIVAVRGITQ